MRKILLVLFLFFLFGCSSITPDSSILSDEEYSTTIISSGQSMGYTVSTSTKPESLFYDPDIEISWDYSSQIYRTFEDAAYNVLEAEKKLRELRNIVLEKEEQIWFSDETCPILNSPEIRALRNDELVTVLSQSGFIASIFETKFNDDYFRILNVSFSQSRQNNESSKFDHLRYVFLQSKVNDIWSIQPIFEQTGFSLAKEAVIWQENGQYCLLLKCDYEFLRGCFGEAGYCLVLDDGIWKIVEAENLIGAEQYFTKSEYLNKMLEGYLIYQQSKYES